MIGFLKGHDAAIVGINEPVTDRVLSALPEKDRSAVLLRVYEGLSGREAAAVEGLDESTMSVRLREALRKCAARLKEESS